MFEGYKTLIAGIGLLGLGVYHASQGNWDAATTAFVTGFGLLSSRWATRKVAQKVEEKL